LQVGHVPRHVEGHDLTLALCRQLVDAGVTLDQQAALRGAVANAHDVLIGLEDLNLHRQRMERLLLLGGKMEDAVQLADHQGVGGMGTCGHPSVS
jgi:hypothetical protein